MTTQKITGVLRAAKLHKWNGQYGSTGYVVTRAMHLDGTATIRVGYYGKPATQIERVAEMQTIFKNAGIAIKRVQNELFINA